MVAQNGIKHEIYRINLNIYNSRIEVYLRANRSIIQERKSIYEKETAAQMQHALF